MKIRLSPILPVTLACGAFAAQFASGCTTERIEYRYLDGGGTGRILDGGGGNGGGGGRSTGGGGGASGASPLGKKCLQDSECKSGLTCLTSGSTVFEGGGPPGGLCTLACTADEDCAAVDRNSICVGFDSAGTVQYCLQLCDQGLSTAGKCQGRSDLVCGSLVDENGQTTVSACQPSCGSDFDCKGRKCDFRTGMCVDTLSGTLPIGSACDPNATRDPCNGVCVNYYDSQDAAAAKYGVCFGSCTLNTSGVGCGVGPSDQPPFDSQCLGPQSATAGDPGLCFQLCDCNGDCRNTAFICRPWGDPASADATGRQGYCRGPVDDKGVAVPDLKCTTTPKPDAGSTKPDAAPPPADAGPG